jgi:hypothetical protein
VRNDSAVQKALAQYRLAIPRTMPLGRSGELLGKGTGSSLEFQEYREYQLGDDLRHIDWSAYARSDTLLVRLFREEITPRLEIIIDASRSMLTQEGVKAQLVRQLTALIYILSSRMGGQPRVYWLDQQLPVHVMGAEIVDRLPSMNFDSQLNISDQLQTGMIPLKPQSIRILISDFLFPHDPAQLIKRLHANASMLHVVQVLSAFESNPALLGGRRLVDVESGQEQDLILNRTTIQEYLGRLHHLQAELALHCRRVHGTFSSLVADHGLEQVCRDTLVPNQLLERA